MTDILDLSGWNVTSKTLGEDGYIIEAEYSEHPTACQKCGVIGSLYRHGPKPVAYRDSPIRGHSVRLVARVQRYKCRECGETFLQPLKGVETERRMTSRCVQYIQAQCLRDTFTRLSEHLGCDEKTIRNIAGDYIARLDAQYQPYLPEWLGIDETGIDGQMRCVLTDVGDRIPIDMLADRDKRTLAGWIHRFKDRSHVQGVAIDMWRPYRDVAALMFPNIPIVIDKFHVVRMANNGMDKVRIRLGKEKSKAVKLSWLRSKVLLNKRTCNLTEKQRFNLDMWLDNEPDIATAYHLKEAFYGIYDSPDIATAGAALDTWRESVPASMKLDFKELLSATKNWRNEILAYFEFPITNGYTEAVNGTAKVMNRAGRGYTFEVLRARVLFGNNRKPRKAKPVSILYPLPEPPQALIAAEPKAIEYRNNIRAKLLRENQCRCMSCQGIYDPKNLYVTRMGPMLEDEPEVNSALLCGACKVRFHTNEVSARESASTPKSE
jgi:transposase